MLQLRREQIELKAEVAAEAPSLIGLWPHAHTSNITDFTDFTDIRLSDYHNVIPPGF
jgi:hypothetical protein